MIFTIYCNGAFLQSWIAQDKIRQIWRDAVKDAGGEPIPGHEITIRGYANRVVVSGRAVRTPS
jgi:hypothetical protein